MGSDRLGGCSVGGTVAGSWGRPLSLRRGTNCDFQKPPRREFLPLVAGRSRRACECRGVRPRRVSGPLQGVEPRRNDAVRGRPGRPSKPLAATHRQYHFLVVRFHSDSHQQRAFSFSSAAFTYAPSIHRCTLRELNTIVNRAPPRRLAEANQPTPAPARIAAYLPIRFRQGPSPAMPPVHRASHAMREHPY